MANMPITPPRLLLGASGAILLARAILGPFHLIVDVDNPLTAATVFALALLAGVITRSGMPKAAPDTMPHFLMTAVLAAVVLCFARAMPFYFISDDYFILTHSRAFTPAHIPAMFTTSDRTFFRPLSELSWYLEYAWAGARPT